MVPDECLLMPPILHAFAAGCAEVAHSDIRTGGQRPNGRKREAEADERTRGPKQGTSAKHAPLSAQRTALSFLREGVRFSRRAPSMPSIRPPAVPVIPWTFRGLRACGENSASGMTGDARPNKSARVQMQAGSKALTKPRIPHSHEDATFGTVQFTPDGPSEVQVSFLDGHDEHFFHLTRAELKRLQVAVEKELRPKE